MIYINLGYFVFLFELANALDTYRAEERDTCHQDRADAP
jgi:hypothetical protein